MIKNYYSELGIFLVVATATKSSIVECPPLGSTYIYIYIVASWYEVFIKCCHHNVSMHAISTATIPNSRRIFEVCGERTPVFTYGVQGTLTSSLSPFLPMKTIL